MVLQQLSEWYVRIADRVKRDDLLDTSLSLDTESSNLPWTVVSNAGVTARIQPLSE
jgi:hypothetical protein